MGKQKTGKRKYVTTISDEDLYALICKYGHHFYLKFKHVWNLHISKEDVIGELAVIACEAKQKYDASERKTAGVKTYLITAFKSKMENLRQRLWIRQVKYPQIRITKC